MSNAGRDKSSRPHILGLLQSISHLHHALPTSVVIARLGNKQDCQFLPNDLPLLPKLPVIEAHTAAFGHGVGMVRAPASRCLARQLRM